MAKTSLRVGKLGDFEIAYDLVAAAGGADAGDGRVGNDYGRASNFAITANFPKNRDDAAGDVGDGAAGDKTALVLHGWGANRATMGAFVRIFTELGWRVCVLDLPGFGASSEPAQVMDYADYARVVAAFCAAKGIAPEGIVGHSFGCKVAAALVAHEGIAARWLVLAGAAGVPRPKPLVVRAKIALAKLLRGAKIASKMRAADAANLSAVMYESFKIAVNDDARGSYKAAAEQGARALILAGRSDTATPLDTQQELAALMKNSALVEFAGGHFFYADAANRAAIAAAIKQFINER